MMDIFKPKNQMKIHLYLSLFFVPVAIMYAITGIGYIFGFNQNSGAVVTKVALNASDYAQTQTQQLENLAVLAGKYGLKLPSDTTPHIVKGKPTIGGIGYEIALVADKNGGQMLQSTKRSLFGTAVMLHKSGGKNIIGNLSAYDFLAIGFGVTLFLLYFSGLVITSFCKKQAKPALISVGSGVLALIIAAYLTC